MKKIIALSALGMLVFGLAAIPAVKAESDEMKGNAYGWEKKADPKVEGIKVKVSEEDRTDLPPAGTIGREGRFVLHRATVVSYSGNQLTISAWGFTGTADIGAAKKLPIMADGSAMTFSAGDKVTLEGVLSNGSVKVEMVRNLSKVGVANDNIRARIQELMQMVEKLKAQLKARGSN